jgi:hypothetical protein
VSAPAHQRLPEFIAVGPPHTAATWLGCVLAGRVGLPEGISETQFFSWYYRLGLDWYHGLFRECPPDLPLVEVATTYFDSSAARVRIKHDIPHCRIICTLRDPVARLYSQYRQLRRAGLIGEVTLEEAIESQRRWDGPGNMFSVSRYAENIRTWQEKFGDDCVLVLIDDDLEQGPQDYLDQVTRFIGIPTFAAGNSPLAGGYIDEISETPRSYRLARRGHEFREWLRQHKYYFLTERCDPVWNYCFGRGASFPPPDSRTEVSLREEFLPEVEALEMLLKRDLTRWKRSGRIAV